MRQAWEYDYIEGPAAKLVKLVAAMNQKGQDGWEVVGFMGIKKGIAADMSAAILKRPVV